VRSAESCHAAPHGASEQRELPRIQVITVEQLTQGRAAQDTYTAPALHRSGQAPGKALVQDTMLGDAG
jgi:hypothetical protein